MGRRIDDLKPKKNEVHILIIEDDAELRQFLANELELRDYHTQTAANGAEALEKVRNYPFNLVISDLKMPVMDGMAVLEKLKIIDPQIEFIMVSGQADIHSAVTAMKMGAFDFLEKPISMEKLLMLIDKALEKSELRMLMALYTASQKLFSSIPFQDLLGMTMNMLFSVFKADAGSFMAMGEDKKLRIVASRGIPEEIVRTTSVEIGERVAGFAIGRKKPLLLIGGLEKYPELAKIGSRPGILSSMVIPVYAHEMPVGVLSLGRTQLQENFTYTDLRNATIFAAQLGQTAYNSRLSTTLDGKMKELETAYRLLEERDGMIEEKDKLAKVGCMIAGMVHEVCNPLTSILGYTDLLLTQEELSADVREKLSIVFNQAKTCQGLMQDLLLYSRRRKAELKNVDLGSLLKEVLAAALPETCRAGVRVRLVCSEGMPPVQGDPQQLQQVFSNLVKNACQSLEALPDRRRLTLKVRRLGDDMQVLVMDNGPGIPAEHAEKIFEPFFTTKPAAKGTGLGLSMVREILHEHGGRITLRRPRASGAVFTITLPLARAAAPFIPSPKL